MHSRPADMCEVTVTPPKTAPLEEVPLQVAGTLEHIVGQLDILTQVGVAEGRWVWLGEGFICGSSKRKGYMWVWQRKCLDVGVAGGREGLWWVW